MRNVRVWVDPICPWCWMTARWLTNVVQPERDLNIEWQPISLFLKNQPSPEVDYYETVLHTHKLLRVFESIDASEGNAAAFAFYWEAGTQIHHAGNRSVDAATLLEAAGLDAAHAAAYDDESWDDVIRQKMDDGLALVGADVGTPIIGLTDANGDEVGVFGPVISRAITGDEGLNVWDAVVTLATTPGFWELKRTRTVDPDFSDAI